MNNSPLVPTPIVDKNGRQTTVHRRGGISSPSSVIPAPGLAVPHRTPEQRVKELVQSIEDADALGDEARVYVSRRLSDYDDEMLDRVEAVSSRSDEALSEIALLLFNEDDEEIVSMAAFFARGFDDAALSHMPALLRGLQFYPDLAYHRDYSFALPVVQEQVGALMKVTLGMEKHSGFFFDDPAGYPVEYRSLEGEQTKFIKNQSTVKLVLRRPHDADAIVELIKEYGSNDPNVLEALLDGSGPAFAGGAL